MSGETEERLTIQAALDGSEKVVAGLAAIVAAKDEAAKSKTGIVTVDDKGTFAKLTAGHKELQTAGQKVTEGFAKMAMSALNLIKVPALFAGISIAVAGLPGLISSVVGSVTALGIGFFSLAAVAGVAKIGLMGVMTAIQQGQLQMLSNTTTAEAYQKTLRAITDASIAVTKAQQGAVTAQRDLANAQIAFQQAPLQAAQAIEQARLNATKATQGETDAVLQLQLAQQNLTQLQRSIAISSLTVTQQTDAFTGKIVQNVTKANQALTQVDITRAQQAILDAQTGVTQSVLSAKEAQQAYVNIQAKGITNSDIYTAALDALHNAQNAVAGSSNSIADAQQKLTENIRASQLPVNAYALALSKLSPIAQGFVAYILSSFIPVLKGIEYAVQNNMLPGVQSGLNVLIGNAGGLTKAFGGIGKSIGDSFNQFMQYWGMPQNSSILSGIADSIAGPNGSIALITKSLEPLGSVLGQVITAATPLFQALTKDLTEWLTSIDKNLKGGGAKGLQDWFSSLSEPIKQVFGLLGDLGVALAPLLSGGAFTKLVSDLRTSFVPAFASLVQTVSNGNLANGMVSVLTAITNVLTMLMQLNNATGGSILPGILATIVGANFLSGVGGLVTVLKGIGGLGSAAAGLLGLGPVAKAGAPAADLLGVAGKSGGIIDAIGGAVSKAFVALGVVNLAADVYGGAAAKSKANKAGWYDISKNDFGNAALQTGLGAATGFKVAGPVGAIVGGGLGAASSLTGDNGKTVLQNITNTDSWSNGAKQIGDFFNGLAGNNGVPKWQADTDKVTKSTSSIGASTDAWGHGAKQISDFFGPLISNSQKSWSHGADQIGQFFSDQGKTAMTNWGHGAQQIGDFFGGLVNSSVSNWTHGAQQISDFFGGLPKVFKNAINGFIGWLDSVNIAGFKPFNLGKLANGGIAGIDGFGHAASGTFVPGGGAYRDKKPYLLAPGEAVISNRNGQVDRNKDLLMSINNNSYNSRTSGHALDPALLAELTKPRVAMQVKVEDMTSADQISKQLAFLVR